MTTLELNYDGLWAEADLDADPDTWAHELVVNRRQVEGLQPDPARADALAGVIAAVLRVSRAQEPAPDLVMLLYPNADDFIVTSVNLRYEEVEGPMTLEQVAEQLRLPAEMLEQPAEEGILETACGPALRLVQRYLSPVSPGIERIQEHVAYAWIFDDEHGESSLAMLSTSFEDLVEAGEWESSLDELAHGLAVHLGADTANPPTAPSTPGTTRSG